MNECLRRAGPLKAKAHASFGEIKLRRITAEYFLKTFRTVGPLYPAEIYHYNSTAVWMKLSIK